MMMQQSKLLELFTTYVAAQGCLARFGIGVTCAVGIDENQGRLGHHWALMGPSETAMAKSTGRI